MDDASIGPYRAIDRLGSGGMGEVYLALDTRLGRKVALKYLSDPALDVARARERLLREARAAAQIAHPNIAAIYDILDAGAHPCIVMEYAQGESLAAIVSRGPLPLERVLAVGVQLADALAHAHAAGVVHRDLKPSNIVLTPEGTAKILDFGLARVHDDDGDGAPPDASTREAVVSRAGVLAGTPAYMAPEQLMGWRASAQSDVYSVGVTLFELLTGQRPYRGPTVAALVDQVLSAPAPLPSDVTPSVPPALDAIVARAMARELPRRYQSAAQLADDLRQAADRFMPGQLREPQDPPLPAPDGPRRALGRRAAGAAAALLAAAAMAAIAYVSWNRHAAPASSGSPFLAILPFTAGENAAVLVSAGAGFSASLVSALEGLSSVSVLSRPDAAEYLSPPVDAGRQALELGVTTIVRGRADRAANGLVFRLEMQRPDGRTLFTRAYRGAWADIAALQRSAAADVVSALGVPLTPADHDRLRRVPACRPDAYGEYAAGQALLDREDVPGNAARAEAAFERAVAIDPQCAPGFAGLADARWARFRDTNDPAVVERASAAIETAYRLDPVSPAINVSLAKLYLNRGKPDQAERIIRDVVARRPHDDEPHRVLAGILEAQGREEEAMAERQRATDLRPASVINHVVQGNALYYAGRYQAAAASYARVLEIQPDNLWAITNLGAAYWMIGDRDRAFAVYRSAPAPDATILANTGSFYLSEGRYHEAAEVLRKAVELDPRSDIKRRNLGDACLRLGSKREALEHYRIAAALAEEHLDKVNPRDARVLARLALYHAKLGRKAEALQHAAQAVSLSPEDNTVLYKRAAVHALLGQPDEAFAWLRRAVERHYSREDARSDPDLESIRTRADVVALLRDDR